MPRDGILPRLLREVEERVGVTAVRTTRIEALEETAQDARTVRRELELLAYNTLDYFSGRTQDLTPEARRLLAQKSRVVWMRDPMAGAAVDLKNDFVLGKGIPRPKAKDPEVQKILDEFWDDPDNKRVITTHKALMRLNTDFELQSNVFVLAFDDGEDGKVKLSLLEHDSVRNVVKHPEDRFCHLWYVAEQRREEWDFDHDAPSPITRPSMREQQVLYYEHWSNYASKVEEAKNASPKIDPPPRPPDAKIGVGKVFHLSENQTTEMAFGHPRMDRTLRWYSAYNSFMEARVDMMKAAAALVMKRKVKGSPAQLARQAARYVSRSGDLAVDGTEMPERGAKVVTENEQITHEAFKLDSGSANAVQDASQLRSQISAATRWPQTYYGDMQNGSLSTSQSLELPVLKGVEGRQEQIEDLVKWGLDLAIERAIDVGRLSKTLTPEERKALQPEPDEPDTGIGGQGEPPLGAATGLGLTAAHEDQAQDEEDLERDLAYEFKLPNPLRRALGDIILAIQNVARTFDPNNTNVDLSRVLLLIALEEMEVGDAADVVAKVFPEGYVDPAVAAAQAQAGPLVDPNADPSGFGEFGPDMGSVGQDGQRHGPGNAYGVPQQATPPEQMQQTWYMPPEDRVRLAKRLDTVDDLWEQTVGVSADRALDALVGLGNGNGH